MNEEIIVLKKRTDHGSGEPGEEEYISFFSNLSDPVDAGLKYVEEENEEDRHEAKWEIQRVDRDNGIFHAERHYDDWPYYIDILSTEAVSKDEIDKGIDLYKDYDVDPRDNPRYYVGNEEERSHRIHDHESTPTSEGFGRRHSTKHAALENLKSLIKLANHLDSRGFAKEADYLDGIIKESYTPGRPTYFEGETFPEEVAQGIYELGLEKAKKSHQKIIDKKIGEEIRAEVDKLFEGISNEERDAHFKATFSTSTKDENWRSGLQEKLSDIFIKVHDDLPPFIISNDQIANSAKKFVSADQDLDPFSVKNQEKRRKERAKR